MITLFNAKKILGRSRQPWVDYARGICIILVVYRHVFEGLDNVGIGSHSYPLLKYLNIFFFSFRMPLFFIVSGIFLGGSLKRKGFGEYITGRFHTIFYPLLIWGSIQVTLQIIFANYANADRTGMDYLNLIIDPRKIEQFWYLNALFFVSVIYALIKCYAKYKPFEQLLLGIFFFAVGTYVHDNHINIGFLEDVFFFYFFFAIGDFIAGFFLSEKNEKFLSSYSTLMVLLPVFVIIQHYFTLVNISHKDDYYVQYQQPVLYVLAALVGGAFIINISFLLQKLKVLSFLRVIGYHSLYIYAVHLIVTAGTRALLLNVFHMQNIPAMMIICILAGVILPIIFFNVAEYFGASWLFSIKKKTSVKQERARLFFDKNIIIPKEGVPVKR